MIKLFIRVSIVLVPVLVLYILWGENDATAASWYVDNAARSAGNGKSWKSAWKDFSKVVWGPGGVKAGDTLYLSGGAKSKTYSGTLKIAAGGSEGKPIAIRPGQTKGHSGLVIFEGNRDGCITVYNQSWITIDGRAGKGMRRFLFQNGIPDKPNALIDSSGMTRFAVRYCDFRNATIGLNSPYCRLSEFDHNLFQDMRGEGALVLNGSQGEGPEGPGWWDSNKVHDNTFIADAPSDGTGKATDMIQGTSALSVYDNIIEYRIGPNFGWQHPDGCQISGRWVRIYRNTFRNCPNAAISMDYGGPEDGHYHMFNNIIECTIPRWRGYMKAWDINILGTVRNCTDMVFANNTVVGINHIQTIAVHVHNRATRLTNWVIKNNIFYECGKQGDSVIIIGRGEYEPGRDVEIDYNLVNSGARGGYRLDINGRSYEQPNPRNDVPRFIRYEYRGEFNDYNLHDSDTAARRQGASLPGYFKTDKNGRTRPNGSAWSIGAYETE